MTEPTLPRIREEIASLPAYKQGRQADVDGFKLSSNENPFPPLPAVVEALTLTTDVNRYPDASAASLRERLADRFGTTVEGVHIAAGSVSILYQLIAATASVDDEVVYAWRSFEAYPGLPKVTGATGIPVPLTPDARHDLPAMAAAVTDRTRAVIVCSPNNPTGPAITSEEFASFVDSVRSDCLIILDEAYAEFVTQPGAVDGLAEGMYRAHPNVVVLRTFSKAYGLAGLRIGYAIGHPKLLDAARTVGIPLSVTAAAELAALASLDSEKEILQRVAVLVTRRDALATALRAQGWDVPDAQGNFIWLPTGDDTTAVARAFDDAGVIVRAFPGDGVRISVGEHESVDKVLQVAASLVPKLQATGPVRG